MAEDTGGPFQKVLPLLPQMATLLAQCQATDVIAYPACSGVPGYSWQRGMARGERQLCHGGTATPLGGSQTPPGVRRGEGAIGLLSVTNGTGH